MKLSYSSNIGGNVPLMLAKVMESVKETTGVDMTEIVKANTYDAKVNRHVVIDGAVPVQKEEAAAAAESDTDSEA